MPLISGIDRSVTMSSGDQSFSTSSAACPSFATRTS
jgi:hypothetical protein